MWSDKAVIDRIEIENSKYDLILANEIDSLPLALSLAKGIPVLYDAHEYSPREYEENFLWRFCRKGLCEYLCKKYLSKANAMTTVCEGIADEYRKNFSVNPSIITNAVAYAELKPAMTSSDRIKLIHHGSVVPGRKIENMIDMMKYLDKRFELYLMLVPGSYAEYFKQLEKKAEVFSGRVFFVSPVKMNEVVTAINKYDIGFYILEPSNFNNEHALPNKFFEFIQARLALAIGPSPEMSRLIREYDCGIVAGSFEPHEMAKRLNELTREKIMHYKMQSHLHARELSAEENGKKLSNIVESLIKSGKNS
jgi:glycosyltransferase involved in cell wall biosynthesis